MSSCPLYSDPTDELLMIIGIFTHFFALETTLAERQFFRSLAKLIGKRSAKLSACGIAAIVNKKGLLEEECCVGADGSLYNVRIAVSKTRVGNRLIPRTEIPGICGQSARRTPGYLRRQRTVSRSGAMYRVDWLKIWFPLSNVITHHAEDGSGIGSAIIAGESPTSEPNAVFVLTSDTSDDEEEERGRTVPKLLINQIHFPSGFVGYQRFGSRSGCM